MSKILSEEKQKSDNPMVNIIKTYGKESSEYQSAVQGYEYGSEEQVNKIARHFVKFLSNMDAALETMDGEEYIGYELALKHIKGFAEEELGI